MALKHKLKTLDGLDESVQALYKKEGEVFILDVDGFEDGDTAGLKKQVETLLGEKKEAKRLATTAEEEAKRLKDEKAIAAGDHESIAKSLREENETLKKQASESLASTGKKEVQRVAMEIAANISEGGNQKILSRFVADRLRHEDGEVKVTDANGNLTISTVTQLTEEFKNNKDYSSLVTGSKSSGGGANNANDKTGGAGNKTVNSNVGGNRQERTAAFAEKYPELAEQT